MSLITTNIEENHESITFRDISDPTFKPAFELTTDFIPTYEGNYIATFSYDQFMQLYLNDDERHKFVAKLKEWIIAYNRQLGCDTSDRFLALIDITFLDTNKPWNFFKHEGEHAAAIPERLRNTIEISVVALGERVKVIPPTDYYSYPEFIFNIASLGGSTHYASSECTNHEQLAAATAPEMLSDGDFLIIERLVNEINNGQESNINANFIIEESRAKLFPNSPWFLMRVFRNT